MNKLIKKIACAVMAFTLVAGVLTGCKAENSKKAKADIPSFTSVKNESGELPAKGTVGGIEYTMLSKDQMGCYNKDRGYYIDQLEQLDSPFFIVISAGTHTASGADIKISDFGMNGSTLVIVVEEYKDSGAEYEGLYCPCAALEVNQIPADLLIISTAGEKFEKLQFS